MKLGQLVHLAQFAHLIKKEELTEEDNERLLASIRWIEDKTEGQAHEMSKADYINFVANADTLFQVACTKYMAILKSGETNISFKCCPTHIGELELMRADAEGFGLKAIRAKSKYSKAKKEVDFFIKEDLNKEPSDIWVHILDGSLKSIGKIPDNEFYMQWQFIPPVIAAIAWRDKEVRYKNGMVDMNRIQRFADVFMHMNAWDAVKCFNHFLAFSGLFFGVRASNQSSPSQAQSTAPVSSN